MEKPEDATQLTPRKLLELAVAAGATIGFEHDAEANKDIILAGHRRFEMPATSGEGAVPPVIQQMIDRGWVQPKTETDTDLATFHLTDQGRSDATGEKIDEV